MDNQSILRELTRKGFNFDESNLQVRSLAIEKYRQYADTVKKYMLEAGIQNADSLGESVREIVADTTMEYIRYYDRLLHKAWIDRSRPIDTVRVNLNDLLCYSEIVAGGLHEKMTALLNRDEIQSDGLVDAEYRDKIAQGYAIVDEE